MNFNRAYRENRAEQVANQVRSARTQVGGVAQPGQDMRHTGPRKPSL